MDNIHKKTSDMNNFANNQLNDVAILKRCNEWFETDAPSISWACRLLHISRETFKKNYAGTKVRVRIEKAEGRAANAKWRVHPWDVLKLVDL